jgi:hypothetical protein
MSTTTTKLGLLKPDATDVISRTTQLNANWDAVDSAIGVVECLSTARPATPYPGMVIRETDTLRILIRNAANSGWSVLGNVPLVSNVTDVTAPQNGQMVYSLTGFGMFVYKSTAAAWTPMSHDDYYVMRKGTSTAVTTSWTAIPFATTSEGNNQGITPDGSSIVFTLNAPGIWTVTAHLYSAGGFATAAALYRGTVTDPSDITNSQEIYSMNVGGTFSGIGGVTVTADIRVALGATRTVRCSAAMSTSSTLSATEPRRSRISFKWAPL